MQLSYLHLASKVLNRFSTAVSNLIEQLKQSNLLCEKNRLSLAAQSNRMPTKNRDLVFQAFLQAICNRALNVSLFVGTQSNNEVATFYMQTTSWKTQAPS
jgi:hypothetical protein